MMATIKVMSVDEDGNISQYMRKAIITKLGKNSNEQRIEHLESIGTDLENAGKAYFTATGALNTGIYANTFCIFASGVSSQATRWIAHVDALEMILPEQYPVTTTTTPPPPPTTTSPP